MAEGGIPDQRAPWMRRGCFVEGNLLLPASKRSPAGLEAAIEGFGGDAEEIRMQTAPCFVEERRMEGQSQADLSAVPAGGIESAVKVAAAKEGLVSSCSSSGSRGSQSAMDNGFCHGSVI